jgi:hypothetical protein
VKTIDITPESAEDVLVDLARHVPPSVMIGRPMVALPQEDGVAVITGNDMVWWVSDHVERLAVFDNGLAEVTGWRDGKEIKRIIKRMG